MKNKKVVIVISVILTLATILKGIIILTNGLGKKKVESNLEKPKEETFVKEITEEVEPNLLKYQEYKNLKYRTTKVEYEKNDEDSYQVNLAMEIINNSTETQEKQYIEIKFFNEEERLLESTIAIIGELAEGETTEVVVSGDDVLRYTTKVEITEYVKNEL